MKGMAGRFHDFLPTYFLALLNVPRLFLVAPAAFEGRELLRRIAWHFGGTLEPCNGLPVTKPRAVCRLERGGIIDPLGNDESISCEELVLVIDLIQTRNPKVIFEFGTAEGRSAANFAFNLPEASIYTLDERHRIRQEFSSLDCFGRITPLTGNSLHFESVPFRGRVDAVFIDGGHDLKTVLQDSLNAIDMIRRGGLIVWHDYRRHSGVTAALRELKKKDRRFRRLARIGQTSLAVLDTADVSNRETNDV